MDSESPQLSAAGSPRPSEEDRRVEELLRVNGRLAAEVRSLTLGRTEAPRSAAMPVARRIGTLIDERDAYAEHLREAQRGVREVNEAMEQARVHIAALERDNAELAATVTHLRSGPRGALRRLLARFDR
jgi:chromosome segregation ATPase